MLTIDQLVKLEAFLTRNDYPFIKDYKIKHDRLLKAIRDLIEDGQTIKQIKPKLLKEVKELYKDMIVNIENLGVEQSKVIYDEVALPYEPLKLTPLVLGLSLRDMIKSRIGTHYRGIVTTITSKEFKINQIKRSQLNATTGLISSYLKSVREFTYGKVERDPKLRGWLYSAILDRKTSNLCISLNGKVYLIEQYPTRSQLPYIPNVSTHLRCRSILIPFYKDDNPKRLLEYDVKDFAKDRPYELKMLIGEKKFKLLQDNDLSFDDIFNFKSRRFYTIKEIKEINKI